MKANRSFLGSLILLATAIIWGSSFFIVKNAVDNIAPNYLIAIRFSGAAVIIGLLCLKKLRHLTREGLIGGIFIGLALYGAYVAQTYGIEDTTPGKNAFLTAVYCVLVPFIFWAFTKKRPGGAQLIAAVICLAGIGLISLDGTLSISKGDALSLLSGVLFAVQIALISLYTEKIDPVVLTFLQFAVAAACAWPTALLLESPPQLGSISIIGALLYLTLIVSALGMLLQNIGQAMTPAATAAILMSLESVFGVFFSVLFWGETVSVRAGIGFALVFTAVVLSETQPSIRRQKGPA